MSLQVAISDECLVTFRAGKRLLSSMGSLMSLQVAISDKCLVTFRAGKRLSPVWVLSWASKLLFHTLFSHTKWILSCIGFFHAKFVWNTFNTHDNDMVSLLCVFWCQGCLVKCFHTYDNEMDCFLCWYLHAKLVWTTFHTWQWHGFSSCLRQTTQPNDTN